MAEGEALAAAADGSVLASAAFWWQIGLVVLGLPFLLTWLRARRRGEDPTPRGATPALEWGWLGTIAAVFAWFAALIAGFVVAGLVTGAKPDTMGLPAQLAVVGGAGVIGLLAGYGTLAIVEHVRAVERHQRAPDGLAVRHGLLRALAFQPPAFACYWATVWLIELGGGEPEPQGLVLQGLTGDDGTFWIVAAFAVLAAPLLEEGFFRGLVQGSVRRFRGPWTANIVAAILFGMAHYEDGNLIAIPTTLLLGLFLGALRERTGGLAAPIAMHAAYNGLAMIGMFIARTWG